MNVLAAALGSALGGVLRYLCGRLWPAAPGDWPRATIAVNLLGCFVIGASYVWMMERHAASEPWRVFWISGVLGGFTTWSAFALETNLMFSAGLTGRALMYAAATVFGCLLAAWAGRALATMV
jgi:CrcB protein